MKEEEKIFYIRVIAKIFSDFLSNPTDKNIEKASKDIISTLDDIFKSGYMAALDLTDINYN